MSSVGIRWGDIVREFKPLEREVSCNCCGSDLVGVIPMIVRDSKDLTFLCSTCKAFVKWILEGGEQQK